MQKAKGKSENGGEIDNLQFAICTLHFALCILHSPHIAAVAFLAFIICGPQNRDWGSGRRMTAKPQAALYYWQVKTDN
jgi:hypothetical protein